eukprot:gnl/TRDRNA2_/TRDRNA2_31018_c0_seq1.p1 gnl/TRDRNA2_/TRDRNA2_31018_c0~~gnl/TRDRNA2_/TRDRNA2_31018_c0_seq1.p1  ORF type:complete len:979 (+),score=129.12 gnl/TRDRNA2_/TRDRNA2_31018_c0_seq1:84-3020(+)
MSISREKLVEAFVNLNADNALWSLHRIITARKSLLVDAIFANPAALEALLTDVRLPACTHGRLNGFRAMNGETQTKVVSQSNLQLVPSSPCLQARSDPFAGNCSVLDGKIGFVVPSGLPAPVGVEAEIPPEMSLPVGSNSPLRRRFTQELQDLENRDNGSEAFISASRKLSLFSNHAEVDDLQRQVSVTKTAIRWRKLKTKLMLANQRMSDLHVVPVVQFSCSICYAVETQPLVELQVQRLGNLKGTSEVYYTTRDRSATAGTIYVATAGKLVFAPDEAEKKISIELLPDDHWHTTLEFAVELLPEGLQGAVRGHYLWCTRVKVLDDDSFPTNRYAKEILNGQLDAVPRPELFLEYCKMNFHVAGVTSGTLKMVLLDQVHNLNFCLQLLIQVYLVDIVLNHERPLEMLPIPDRDVMIFILMGVTLLVFALLHVLDYRSISWKVGGKSRAALQVAIMRKFLNYDDVSRAAVTKGEITLAVLEHARDVVHDGFLNVLEILQGVGQLVVIVAYQCALPALFGKPFSYSMLLILICLPAFMGIFMLVRKRKTRRVLRIHDQCHVEVVESIGQTVDNYRMIADYMRRPLFIDRFEKKILDFNKASTGFAQVTMNNIKSVQWAASIAIAGYTVFGGRYVIQDPESYTIGLLLANLSVLGKIGSCLSRIYMHVLRIQTALPGLVCLTRLLNLPLDLHSRMNLQSHNQEYTRKCAQEIAYQMGVKEGHGLTKAGKLPIDLLPIVVEDIEVVLGKTQKRDGTPIWFKNRMEIKQGRLISIVAGRGHGKSTFLKVLGGVSMPNISAEGCRFFVPAHLRVLHVAAESLFFVADLLSNLTLGVDVGDDDGNVNRVRRICSRLGLPPEVTKYIHTPDEILAWHDVFSRSQVQLLCIARALVANFEVSVFHVPTGGLDDITSNRLLLMLQEYVDEKGVVQNDAEKAFRRPRTCIFSAAHVEHAKVADEIWLVSQAHGLQQIEGEDLCADLMA